MHNPDAPKAILALAQVILKAGNALEASDWPAVERLAKEAAARARALQEMVQSLPPCPP